MSAKTSADVLIGGKIYTLSGYESEEYLHKVASYINSKISEFNGIEDFKHLPGDMKSTLLELNIADDFFKAKHRVETLEQDIEAHEAEVYDVKHDLISLQIKLDTFETANKKLEEQNKELLLYKARLEAALDNPHSDRAVSNHGSKSETND